MTLYASTCGGLQPKPIGNNPKPYDASYLLRPITPPDILSDNQSGPQCDPIVVYAGQDREHPQPFRDKDTTHIKTLQATGPR